MTKLDRMKMLMAAVAALGLVAAGCGDDGDDDDDDDMVMLDGGTDAGGDTTVMCGEATCGPLEPLSGFEVAACCADDTASQCGLLIAEGEPLSLAELISQLSTDVGCVGLNEPGVPAFGPDETPFTEDDECPSLETVTGSPLTIPMQDPVNLPGCCQPSGTCGFLADFSEAVEGLNFGCSGYDLFDDTGTPGSCTFPE